MVIGSTDCEARLPKVRPQFRHHVIFKQISAPGLPVEAGCQIQQKNKQRRHPVRSAFQINSKTFFKVTMAHALSGASLYQNLIRHLPGV